MNSTNQGVIEFLKKVLVVVSLSAASLFGFVLLISFLLIKTPQYEKLYFFVPYVAMTFSAVIIAFLSKFYRELGIYIALASSAIFALISVVLGIVLKWDISNVLAVVGRHVGLIALSPIFTALFQNKKRKKVRSKGNFRFSK